MRRLVVVGGGGHAKVVLDILSLCNDFTVIGCIDPAATSERVLDVEVLGGDECLPRLRQDGVECAFVAIGDNARRTAVAAAVAELGFELATLISPTAVVASSVTIGCGVVVTAGAVLQADAEVGDLAIINTSASVDHDCVIGAGAHIAPGCTLAGRVRIGEGVLLGAGSVAIPGVQVGAHSIVGAGAVIIEDIPSGVLALGVPARIVKQL